MNNNINISELICTRISHDLGGNIGALGNAIEILDDDDDDFLSETKSTLKVISFNLNARLKFFRMTFGLTNGNLEKAEIVSQICQDYLKTLNPNYKTELVLQPIDGQTELNRALMLALMIAADLLIKGGQIKIYSASRGISAEISSEYRLAQSKIDAINDILADKQPDNIAQYTPVFCLLKMGASVSIKNDETSATLLIA